MLFLCIETFDETATATRKAKNNGGFEFEKR